MKNPFPLNPSAFSGGDDLKCSRRRLLELGAAGLLAASFAPLAGCAADEPPINALPVKPLGRVPGFGGRLPNIVFIYADDLGYGDLSCYGSRAVRTPNIDRLSREGVTFTDFYSCNALCSPARYGLLTGRYPQRSGLDFPLWEGRKGKLGFRVSKQLGHLFSRMGLADMGKESSINGIPTGELTLAEALREAGYQTWAIGKWHIGDFGLYPEYHPENNGFDRFFGVPYSNGQDPFPLYRGKTQIEENIQGDDQAKLSRIYTEEAIKYLDERDGRPFFLYLPYNAPHRPLHPSEKFRRKSRGGLYGDVVEELDHYVGKLLDALRDRGLEQNTLVFFSSDNGPWYNGSAGGLRGGKGQSFEGGFRVPLIAKWPGRIRPNSRCGEMASILDIFPTLLAIAGVNAPVDRVIDGKNITGLLTGKSRTTPHETLYFYHHDDLEGVRNGSYKYYRMINHYKYPLPTNKKWGGVGKARIGEWPLLYDLSTDPGESYNLAQNMPEVAERMEGLMRKWEAEMAGNAPGIVG